ncbi:hypothetical protein MCAL160_0758 [Mycoplasmopsis californica HAZ160_1]|uniref:DUF2714 domain-containing protein n=1 Tax=Mycoplasmopsis californica HAZ160_1 TaxID=1397850 RepID=A0AAT9F8H7_9BACT|nr:DUF2714 domain-containing protein [Mycoplasmopsis californica]BAP01187.1 hypothetical protein MCAL160_0758 [Mycoplasmopsis californica HAZ160_1]BBG41056.1 hypothetical protein MCAL106_0758 [Mycoplasmopsis californica]BBG41649.1 hypothetical protein MCAL106E_0758 [Mycoplasmopsis californica]BBG42243.1 hypothetical protein MCAL106L_0758 [Mycoplasmopsis californica]BBG42822.1 hypothetical protein MCAL160E_0758 [Mycoplasmopsis californica]
MNKSTRKEQRKIKELNRLNELVLFDLYSLYNEKVQDPRFINFTQLNASILLSMGLGFESPIYTSYTSAIKNAVEKRFNIVFKEFIIGFDIIPKFSETILVPIITQQESSATDSINVRDSEHAGLNEFLSQLNIKIAKLINDNYLLEVIPGSVMFKSQQTGKLKLLFGKDLLARIEN